MSTMRFVSVAMLIALVGGCGKGMSIPATPEGTVEKVASEIANDKPQVVWHALPARYQRDVKEVISAFADKMDADVWNRTFALLRKASQVTKDKKEFILAMAENHHGGQLEQKKFDQLNEHWDRVVGIFDTLIDSEIKTVDGLKKLDPERFLANTGSKLSKDIKELATAVGDKDTAAKIENLGETKATVVTSEGDKATIKVEATGEPAETVQMVKVDGKWLPADMVANWDTSISQLKKSIEKMELEGRDKEMYLSMLGELDQALDKLLAAESQEDFNEAAGGLMPLIMGFGGSGLPAVGGPPTFPDFPAPGEFSVPQLEDK